MKMTAKKVLNKILTVCLIISLIVGMTPATFAKAAPTIAISGTVNNSGDYISLNWSNSDSTGSYRYMVTKKDGSSTTYQTIPLKRTAKVLNIYPGGGTLIAGRTDLAGKPLDTSANVKLWMEEEGVGKSNGNTLITVDCINITDFNNNPSNYLHKDSNGNYNYDVVFTGAWDDNNSKDLTNISEPVIQSFITAGGGYLGGHDTTNGYNNIHPYFNALAKDNLNMELDAMIPVYGSTYHTAPIDINIVKKGSLINYPWTVSGTKLTVPSSHTSCQFAMGDVWMKYAAYEFNTNEKMSYNGNAGTNNFYLTSWNNTAMIQTGHSNGNATIDEKKILANTLLYLAQISTETTFDDHTAQDVTAPNSIDASTVQINVDVDKKATVTFTGSVDNGSTYSYQLKAMGMSDNSTTLSAPTSQTITSGMKGYAIVVDKTASTVPSDTVTTTSCTYDTTALSAGTWYAHIKAIDNVGNVSSVIHVPFTVSQAASTVTTDAASSITANGAVLNGTVNANSASTNVTFEYGTSTSYGSSVTAVGSPVSGASAAAVNGTLSGLSPNTSYHYRVKAVNAGGTTYGNDRTFTTPVFYPTELVNGGFEYPSLSGKVSNSQWWYNFYPFATSGIAAGYYSRSSATGIIAGFDYNLFNWNTTAQGASRFFEVGTKPDVASWGVQFVPEGNQFIELNADDVTATYQDLATTPGQVIYWSLYQGGVWYSNKQDINNTMAVRIGTQSQLTDTSMLVTSQTAFDQSWSKRVIYNINNMTEVTVIPSAYSGKDADKKQLYTEAKRWTKYEGVYVVPEGQTVTRFAFASLSTADSLTGNMLDGISFRTATAQETTQLVIPATAISINGTGASDSITTNGGSVQMQSVITPSDATYQTVNWSVENGTGSASITQAGLLTAITNGTVTVKATAKDGVAVIGSKTITISGQVPASTYTVSGTIKDTNINAVTGAAIVLTNTTDATKTYSGTTDVNGDYSITGVPNGIYSITVTKNGETLGSGSITVNGSNVSGGSGNITVTPATPPALTYTASGTIKDTNNNAVSGAAIVLTNTTDVTKTYSGTTDTNGDYSITGVPNGTYSITVIKNGETLGSGSITVNGSNVSGGSGNITVTPATPTPTTAPTTAPTPAPTPAPAPSTSEQVDKVTEAENAIDNMNNSDKASIIAALEKLEVLNQDELGQMKRDSLSELSHAIKGLENVKVVIENSAEGVDIKISDSEYLALILTSKELKSGEEIIIKLTIKDFRPELFGTSQIEKAATELGKNVGGYVDITLTKQVGNQEPVIVSETKGDIYVCVVIPENLRGHNNYQMIREHSNETKLLYDTDNDPNTITVPTNQFSTYAIAYTEALSAEEEASNGLVTGTVLEKGKTFTNGLYTYEVTKSGKVPQVTVIGFVKGKYAKKMIIADTVDFNGITYKVTAIQKKAFYKDSRITSVSIGDNVTTIGSSAFYGCSALKSITIGAGLKTLNNHCFCQCIALKTVTIKSTQLKKTNGDHFFYNVKGATFYLPKTKVEGYKKLLSLHNKRLLKDNTFSKMK